MEMPSASHGNEHQHDHHRNGDEAAAAAAISPATAAIVVVSTATAAGQLHLPNKMDLGCTCPLFDSNSSRDASGNTGHYMTDQNRNPNSI
mgnify:FL=1